MYLYIYIYIYICIYIHIYIYIPHIEEPSQLSAVCWIGLIRITLSRTGKRKREIFFWCMYIYQYIYMYMVIMYMYIHIYITSYEQAKSARRTDVYISNIHLFM